MVLCSSRSCSTTQTQLCFGKLLPQVPLSHLHVPSMAWGPARPPHQGCSSKRCHQLPSPAPQGRPSLLRGTVRAHIHPEQHGMGLSTWGAAPQSRYAWYQLWASLLYLIHGFISSVALSRPRLYLVRGFISSVALSHLGFPQASSPGLEELSRGCETSPVSAAKGGGCQEVPVPCREPFPPKHRAAFVLAARRINPLRVLLFSRLTPKKRSSDIGLAKRGPQPRAPPA